MRIFRRLTFFFWYFGNPPWDTGISPPELMAFLSDHPPGRAIDLGCGTGTNVITLAKRGWQVVGVDFAASAIRRARQKIQQAKVDASVLVADVTRLDGIQGPFDFALDLGCFHGLAAPDKVSYLTRLEELLAAKGYWMLYGRLMIDPHQGRFGLTSSDLDLIQSRFRLVSRQDGFNRNRQQPAAYLLLQKP